MNRRIEASDGHRAIPVDDDGNPLAAQPPRNHGDSEVNKTTPDGLLITPTIGETVLQVKPKNQAQVLSNIHQHLLEKEQGITYTTDNLGRLVGVKKSEE